MLFEILAKLADAIGVLALWGIGDGSPWWVKLIITGGIVILAIISWPQNKLEESVKDFDWDNPEEFARLFIKKNINFIDNSVASIYVREGNSKKLVALGYVIIEDEKPQIMVFKNIDKDAMLKIRANLTNYKKYSVKPSFRYDDIDEIKMM